jgi:hypothetical protein
MKRTRNRAVVVLTLTAISLAPARGSAHCDSLTGPVVQDAQLALRQGDPTPVLKWVRREDESEIRAAFAQTVAVRTTSDEAKALADRHFFETLVRVHRAGEGEAFTGLKRDGVDPGIAAADQALHAGSSIELEEQVSAAVRDGIRKRFAVALERRKHAAESVESGREWVAAYVDYIHFVERVEALTAHGAAHGHQIAGAPADSH